MINLYTDGACSGNPGPGGWAFILKINDSEITNSGFEKYTTNQQMELKAIVEGLKHVKEISALNIYSDSKYALDGMKSWLNNWKRNGWKTANKKPVKNQELWKELDLLIFNKKINFIWVKGHNGHIENERCDKMAVGEIEKCKK